MNWGAKDFDLPGVSHEPTKWLSDLTTLFRQDFGQPQRRNTVMAIGMRVRPFATSAVVGLFCLTTLASCSRIQEPEENWLFYGNDHSEQRYSALEQITSDNVASLKLDWELPIEDAMSFVSTPLAIDGVLYFSGDRAIV